MSSFLYRLAPDAGAGFPTRADLVRLDLFHLVGRGFRSTRPGDASRIVGPVTVPEPMLDYRPAEQTWIDRADNVKLGWWNANPPRPDALFRREARWRTAPVVMGDGEAWEVPILMGVGEMVGLPLVMAWERGASEVEGHWTDCVQPRYERTRALFNRAFAEIMGSIGVIPPPGFAPLSRAEQCSLVCDALSLVYRIGEPEASALGLFTPEALGDSIRAILDAPRLLEIAQAMIPGLSEPEEI